MARRAGGLEGGDGGRFWLERVEGGRAELKSVRPDGDGVGITVTIDPEGEASSEGRAPLLRLTPPPLA